MIRPLELFDLPSLYRARKNSVSLDHARSLTRGNPLGAVGMLSYLNPSKYIYSLINDENAPPAFGGVIHTPNESFARLSYLAPVDSLEPHDSIKLIDDLLIKAGEWGAFYVIAEAEENKEAYPVLRKAGFSVYAWQRMWDLSHLKPAAVDIQWQPVADIHLHEMQSLYYQIVPALMHPIEQAPRQPRGLICFAEQLRGFVTLLTGPYGIVLMPFIHPETTDVAEKLVGLVQAIPSRRKRPVYLCVRSYQAWLEPVLEDMGARASERQAVMVKHLAHLIKEEQLMKARQPAGVMSASRYSQK